jgi:hypothetical protein
MSDLYLGADARSSTAAMVVLLEGTGSGHAVLIHSAESSRGMVGRSVS